MYDKERIITAYIEFYNKNKRFPEDATEFANYLGSEAFDFLKSFNPLVSLKAFIWEEYFDKALNQCQQDPNFESYACREVYLSILYNLVNVLNERREMNKAMISFTKSLPSFPKELKKMKVNATAFYKEMISAGQSSGEIASRPLVDYQYNKWCWYGTIFVVFFWIKDTSEQNEQTDVAIEKVAHLIFDILNPNAVDSSIEFFTFLFKQGFK